MSPRSMDVAVTVELSLEPMTRRVSPTTKSLNEIVRRSRTLVSPLVVTCTVLPSSVCTVIVVASIAVIVPRVGRAATSEASRSPTTTRWGEAVGWGRTVRRSEALS